MRSSFALVLLPLFALLLLPASPAAAQSDPPKVSTGRVVDLMPTGATITGLVNPRGRVTSVHAQFGPPGNLSRRSTSVRVDTGTRTVSVRVPVSNLKPATQYAYRLVARNRNGTRMGSTRTFTTPRVPASVTLSAAAAVVTFGETVALSGSVGGTGAGGSRVQPELAEAPFTAGFSPAGNALVAAADGTFGLTVEPRVTTQYRARATVDKKQAISPVVTIGVAPKVRLSIRRRSKASFSGSVQPGGDAVVRLLRISSTGKRKTVARTVTRGDDRSTYRFPRRRIRSTRDYVVTVTPASSSLVRGESRVRTVRRTTRR